MRCEYRQFKPLGISSEGPSAICYLVACNSWPQSEKWYLHVMVTSMAEYAGNRSIPTNAGPRPPEPSPRISAGRGSRCGPESADIGCRTSALSRTTTRNGLSVPEYLKCACGCGGAVSPEYWGDHNLDGPCPKCGYLISVHTRHDLVRCARA